MSHLRNMVAVFPCHNFEVYHEDAWMYNMLVQITLLFAYTRGIAVVFTRIVVICILYGFLPANIRVPRPHSDTISLN